jgi:hypothetical protein
VAESEEFLRAKTELDRNAECKVIGSGQPLKVGADILPYSDIALKPLFAISL